MSEVQSRPAGSRGRGSARGGRGGHSSRGGRGGPRTSKPDAQDSNQLSSFEDEGEIGQLKKKHSSSLSTLKELFPDWTDEDLVFALEDADGDLEVVIERITEGNVSQWGEVKKKHGPDRSRNKGKEDQPAPAETTAPSSRGGRGRGAFEGRGRARGDRGRAGRGGRAGGHVNGTRADKPAPATQVPETTATTTTPAESWPTESVSNDANAASSAWGQPDGAKEATEKPQKSSLIPEGSTKGWASLFAKPAPPPQKKPPAPATTASHAQPSAEPAPAHQGSNRTAVEPETAKQQPPVEHAGAPSAPQPAIPEIKPKDDGPEARLEQQSVQVQELSAVQEPSVIQQQEEVNQQRAANAGYSTASYKPTPGAGRGPNLQRRVLDQREAVVMPGNHAVDRAAVQFGSMGLNGSLDDIDDEREDAETRPQPPQHSPVAPRASLPPSTQGQASSEAVFGPRPAPGLPPVPQAAAGDASFNEFGRYGEAQKPYDPFSQQMDQSHSHIQEPFSSQTAIPSQPAATTAAEYSAFYGDQARNPYYYGNYGQPQDPATAQRATGGFAATGADAQSQIAPTQPPGRYGHVEAPNSGHNTPNPVLPGQAQPSQPSQHMPQAQGAAAAAAAAHGAYNYGYPYYSNPHYPASYMNQQHQYGRNRPMYDDARRYEDHYAPPTTQYGYGNQFAPYAKGGMYGQPQHAFSYDQHSSSPANAGAFNPGVSGREASYGRTNSAQPPEGQQPTGSHTFGGMTDVFGRTQAGFGQNQGIPSQQQQPTSAEEASKGFEAPKAGGPSPSVAHANRPGSATNTVPTQPVPGHAGLPPMPAQQGNQQAFGGYPHLNPQYGGLGGLVSHQNAGSQAHHQGNAYGSYGAGFGSNYYGNTGRGGGWGGNYGH